jgi:long-chain acyl-CoA synthetase
VRDLINPDMATGPIPSTLTQILTLVTERSQGKPDLLNYKKLDRWVPVSTEEFSRLVRDLALGFYSIGIRPGDHVAILSENRIEWTLSDLALLAIGAADVPIYATQAAAQVEFILRDSASRMLMVSTGDQLRRVASAVSRVENVERVIHFDPISEAGPAMLSLPEVLAQGSRLAEEHPQLYDQLTAAVRPDDLATLIYTSGTTGEPKGVMLTHRNISSNVVAAMDVLGYEATDTVLSLLPLAHSFERMVFYCYLYCGLTVYYAESLDKVAQNMQEVQPTVVVGVPRLFEKMFEAISTMVAAQPRHRKKVFTWALDVGRRFAAARRDPHLVDPVLEIEYEAATTLVLSKIKRRLGLDRIRCLISGGAALSPEIATFFQGLGIEILQGYGLTETSPVVTVNPPTANRVGSAGKPIPGVEVRIAEDGEILVRGPNVMRGYHNRPLETQAAFAEDGWLSTGDLGHLDEDGYLWITDRKKDLIKTSGGKYVAPQLIEGRVIASPLIAQVFVTGNERKFPAALIVPNLDSLAAYARSEHIAFHDVTDLLANPTIVELYQSEVDRLTTDLSPHEKIKKVALLPQSFTIDSGEMTPTMKLRRRAIETAYKDVIDRLYMD